MCKFFMVLLFYIYSVALSQINSPLIKPIPYTSAAISEDPYNPDWDWNTGDVLLNGVPHYWIYYQNKPNAMNEYASLAPWYQSYPWPGLIDRKKEDGWVLLSRDFGTPERRLDNRGTPYFVLYNKNRSILRVFMLINNLKSEYNFSTVELMQQSSLGIKTGVLAHLSAVSSAVDKIDRVYENTSSSIVNTLASESRWVYADFPMAYDPNLKPLGESEAPPSLTFLVYGTLVTDVVLETKGLGGQGDRNFVEAFMHRNNFDSPGFSLNSANMPKLDVGFNLPGVDIKATAPNWGDFKKFAQGLSLDMGFGSVSVANPLKGLIGGFEASLSAISMASPLGIAGLNLGSVFKFFVGGGMKAQNGAQSSPSFISMHYSTKGTMTSKVPYAALTIAIPGSRSNYNTKIEGNPVGLVRNEPFGIMTIKSTPKVYRRLFQKDFPVANPSLTTDFFFEYEVADNIDYVMNDAAGLELVNMEAFLVSEYTARSENNNWLLPKIGGGNQKFQMQIESPMKSDQIQTRSMPVPYKHFKGRKIYQTNSIWPYVKMKVKATLKRKDDPTAQPIVFISMYEVEVVDQGVFPPGTHTISTMPVIPPQNVQCIVPALGGVRISWDRNQEGNIVQYIVERSINNGSYVVIGKTKDTLVVDNEVEKSVKPYLSNRLNVSVNYRVRAKSEWFDDDSTKQVQFSDYSNIVSISGSIINTLNKFGAEQIIPNAHLLSQNFPNPFNPSTTIYYGVKENAHVNIKVFNAIGQEVAMLVNDLKEVGYHYADWNAAGLPSGMYFYRITVGDFTETKKMTLMK